MFIFCLAGWYVRVPNSRLVCCERLLSTFLDLLRMHLNLLGIWSEPFLRWHKGDDWILPNDVVEILLDYFYSHDLHRKYYTKSCTDSKSHNFTSSLSSAE